MTPKVDALVIALGIFALTLPAHALAAHYCHGHGDMTMVWDMSALDTDNDGVLSFDEFIAPNLEKWRSGFGMIDTNGDGEVGAHEWDEFLGVHGMKPGE